MKDWDCNDNTEEDNEEQLWKKVKVVEDECDDGTSASEGNEEEVCTISKKKRHR
jgi:hypothetical protein